MLDYSIRNFNVIGKNLIIVMSAINLGYKCFYFPESKIWHKTSKSINKTPGMQIYYMTRNMFYFMKRQSTTLQYAVFLLFFFGIKFWYIIILFCTRKI